MSLSPRHINTWGVKTAPALRITSCLNRPPWIAVEVLKVQNMLCGRYVVSMENHLQGFFKNVFETCHIEKTVRFCTPEQTPPALHSDDLTITQFQDHSTGTHLDWGIHKVASCGNGWVWVWSTLVDQELDALPLKEKHGIRNTEIMGYRYRKILSDRSGPTLTFLSAIG